MTPYQKPPDEPLTWETNEQLVLRHISHVYKKKFYNSPQALRTWDRFDSHAKITTDQFQQFKILLTEEHFDLGWWNIFKSKNADVMYFIQIKKIWATKKRFCPSCVLLKRVPQGRPESGSIATRRQCWATSAQRRCHPEEALYLPTFSHPFDCQ